MSFRIDMEHKEIRASVGELASLVNESRHGMGLFSQARTAIGNRIHAQYRAHNHAQAGFSSEVEVRFDHHVDDFHVLVKGRVDGIRDDGQSICVEEVKSVLMSSASLSRAHADYFPDFALQVRLYAEAISRTYKNRNITAKLILVSVVDAYSTHLNVSIHPEATMLQIDNLLREAIELQRQKQQHARHLRKISGRLSFPYPKLRPHQRDLMDIMKKGLANNRPVLAMAPTGIGKTSAALVPALEFSLKENIPLLFLTSRTSQRELVARTFLDICHASGLEQGDIRCLTLKTKQDMCPPGHLLCHPESCEFLADFQSRLKKSTVLEQLLSQGFHIRPEAIKAVGEAHRLCPFHLSRYLLDRVQLLIGDFNHAFDPSIALDELYPAQEPGPVLVIDEAHNLFDRARKIWSPFLSRAEIGSLCSAIESGQYLAKAHGSRQTELDGMQSAIDGKGLFNSILAILHDVDMASTEAAILAEEQNPGSVEDCRPTRPKRESWRELSQRAMEALVPYLVYNRIHGLVRPNDPLLDFLGRIIKVGNLLMEPRKELVPYVAGPMGPDGAGFGCSCVNPAPFLAERHRKAKASLAMSATLSPLDYYSDVLGFSSMDPISTSLPSAFPEENLGVFICSGPDTTYKHRGESYSEISRIIEQTLGSRDGRYAVFFPSFKYLADVRAKLRLGPTKIFVQLPGLSQDSRKMVLDRFRKSNTPALLLAVMGGAFGEGVDLPGDELIGAIIVSPGLPKVGFERSVMQIYFQDEYERGFSYSMLYPGIQRVIQSAGRVIRSSEDRGVVVLVGKRFSQNPLLNSLPEHWYKHAPEELVCDDLPGMLSAFWNS